MHLTRPLLASILTVLSSSAFADPIAAQPIGLLDSKNAAIVEPSDFFTLPGKVGAKKLLFTAKVKDLTGKRAGKEQRSLFVQDIVARNLVDTRFKVSDSPLKRLTTYTVTAGTKLDGFVKSTDAIGNKRLKQMFFHVPGAGLYVTEGGAAPKTIRAEKATDATTGIVGGALRLSDYANNFSDPTLQSRFFFTAKDPKKGREPFLYGGKAALLKDIYTDRGVGSDPYGFAVLGPQNATQKAYFLAASPTDGDIAQLWQVTLNIVKKKPVYGAVPFTTGATALTGAPINLVANGSDLFFNAPVNGVRELWHLRGNGANVPSELETLTTGGRDPQQLTFNSKDTSLSVLAFTVVDNGVRRYARYSFFNNNVTVLGVAAGITNPQTITDAGQEFYFNGTFTDGFTYLIKHNTSDNSLETVRCSTVIPGNVANFIYNVGEICAVSSTGPQGGRAGFVYFVASAYVDGGYRDGVLFKLAANQGPALAEPVRTPTGNLVLNAKNLREVLDNGSPGIFRLYFAAPVSSTVNAEFLPAGSTITDFGFKPWVTAEQ